MLINIATKRREQNLLEDNIHFIIIIFFFGREHYSKSKIYYLCSPAIYFAWKTVENTGLSKKNFPLKFFIFLFFFFPRNLNSKYDKVVGKLN